jgi:cupin 2 domain-containing protein
MPNVFENIPADLPDELIETLAQSGQIRIERIVSQGHGSPDGFWYDQVQDEFVILLAGAARLRFDDSSVDLKPGDYILIPAHRRHRVDCTAPGVNTVWLAVFFCQFS